ncbi:MAG: hypothetical protein AAGL29_08910 [Bacteroidota bacterium]
MTKWSVLCLFLVLGSLSQSIRAQQSHFSMNGPKFYEMLAERDAQYERTLGTMTPKDEIDYWKDQEVYEKRLREQHPEAFAWYMTKKKAMYQEHYVACEVFCVNSATYWSKVKEYLQVPTEIKLFELGPSLGLVSSK